jgi:hypothetical protein
LNKLPLRETLERSLAGEYFSHQGLYTLTGLSPSKWDSAILKELLDNALDALNDCDHKRVEIEFDEEHLTVFDSGPGISTETLESVHDFNIYVSSKHDFRTPTRGAQGNALKTVIGICDQKDYTLIFYNGEGAVSGQHQESGAVLRKRAHMFTLRKPLKDAGVIKFEHITEESTETKAGVSVLGSLNLTNQNVYDVVIRYRSCNPDVTFVLNGETFEAVTGPIKQIAKTFVHWYDFKAFNALLQAIVAKDHNRTVREFCGNFSGAQRILSSLTFPHKKLAEFHTEEQEVQRLYEELKQRINPPTPNILKNLLVGKQTFLNIYDSVGYGDLSALAESKYKKVIGEYRNNGAIIPYALEGALLPAWNAFGGITVVVTVNGSVPYGRVPFVLTDYRSTEFCNKWYSSVGSLQDLLSASKFTQAEGLLLHINFISPYVEFTDKSKSRIIADAFWGDVCALLEPLCRNAIKEVERAERARRRQDREAAFWRPKKDSKKELVLRHFREAYDIAKGPYSSVTARQVFYKLREIISRTYGVTLEQNYYGTFTQDILTELFSTDPALEQTVVFERRGFFSNPLFGDAMPLGTREVNTFVGEECENKIYRETRTVYSIPPELQYSKVLFIEKHGYDTIFKESGLTKRLNLGVLSTQGFGTRASKKLMRHLIDRGIAVYVLHDCDIAGYLIHDRIARGSATYEQGLEVKEIGLTVDDVVRSGKANLAEHVTYKKSYTDSLDMLSKPERDFFRPDPRKKEYRRVELNALTNEELITFIEGKIPNEPLKPDCDVIERYVKLDEQGVIKNALYKALSRWDKIEPVWEDVAFDKGKIVDRVCERVDRGEHWVFALEKCIAQYEEQLVATLAKSVQQCLGL